MQEKRFFSNITRAKILIVASLCALFIAPVLIPSRANAQVPGPQIFMTWQAVNSYAPPGYAGKILPNQESQIVASVAVIDGGELADLSNQTIYWYDDDNLIGSGVGIQRLVFNPHTQAPDTVILKVELPDYPSGLLIHEISIPIVQPQAVIEAAYPDGDFSASPAVAQALPYFFATTSTSPLSFAWSVNGQAVTSAENPQSLQISLPQSTPAGFAVGLNLTIQNSIDSTSASANTNLTYSPTP